MHDHSIKAASDLNGFDFTRGQVEWATFEWIHVECFPNLIQLASLLPQKEDNLRGRVSKVACLPFTVFKKFVCLLTKVFTDITYVKCSFCYPFLNLLGSPM